MTNFGTQLEKYANGNLPACNHPIKAVDNNNFCHKCGKQLEVSQNAGVNYVEALLAQNAEQAAIIARLTAAAETMQEDAVQNTYAFNLMLTANKAQAEDIRAMKEAIEDIKIYCNNPSAWDHYDDGVREKIRAILKAAGMA